jgi:hypothetical protein
MNDPDLIAQFDIAIKEIRDEIESGALDVDTLIKRAALWKILAERADRIASEGRDLCNELLQAIKQKDAEISAFHENLKSRTAILEERTMGAFGQIQPHAERGITWSKVQTANGFRRHEEDQKKHSQWRQWQEQEASINSRFSAFSKTEQARQLKNKYSIRDNVATIAKRLADIKASS